MELKEQYEKLLRYCCSITKDPDISEDIVQETYLKFWQNHTYKESGKELAYLYVIARNLCMDEIKKRKFEDVDSCEEIPGPGDYEPESCLNGILLETALERIPDDIREILILRYTDDMKIGDIAKVANISRFAVHRRLKEGIKLLRKELGDE